MSLKRFKNTDQVNGNTPTFGRTLETEPFAITRPLSSNSVSGNLAIGLSSTPNLEYHVYSADNLIQSRVGLPIKSTTDGSYERLKITPEKDLRDVGIKQGAYSIVYNFLQTVNTGVRLNGISEDRTEIVLGPNVQVFGKGFGDSDISDPLVNSGTLVDRNGDPISSADLGPTGNSPVNELDFRNLRNYVQTLSGIQPDIVLNFGDNKILDVANLEFDGRRVGLERTSREYPTGVFNGTPTIFVPTSNALETSRFGSWIPFIELYNPAINEPQGLKGVVTGRARRFKLKRAADVPANQGFVNRVIWEPGVTIYTDFDYPEDLSFHPTPNSKFQTFNTEIYYDWFNESIDVYNRLIVKLTEPLPENYNVGDICSADVRIKKSWVEKIIAFPSLEGENRPSFSEPDFNATVGEIGTTGETEFESYNTLLDVNATTSQQLISKYFSGSLGEMKLNIDYSDFTNFVHFSSATERVDNFLYKIQQIEKFNARIDLLETVSGSDALTNISQSIVRRDRIIGGFDDFEHYLYYDEDSNNYTHWTSSANTITPYPKSSTFPHVLESSTSDTAVSWYNGTYDSASLYDSFNDARLRNMIPIHLQEDERNGEYITFVDMIGQHFDIQWSYIDSLTKVNSREEHPRDGMSSDLLSSVASSLGWKLSNGYSDVSLWKYALGVESDGTLYQTGSLKSKPREEIVKETWRRIVNTIPMLYKTKGTARSIKAILSTYGIPQAFLQIREWGGPTVSTRKNVFERERFVNKLEVSATEYISSPWGAINGNEPQSIEVITKLPKGDHNIFRLEPTSYPTNHRFDVFWDYDEDNNRGRIQLKRTGTTIATSPYVPYLNRKDAVVAFSSASLETDGYEIAISFVDDFGEVLASERADVSVHNLSNVKNAWEDTGNVYVGSGSTSTTSSFQELRYYTKRLSTEILDEHAKNREAYFSDDNTTDLDIDTSYETLVYRIQPDSGFTTNTSSISSVHPNQTITSTDGNVILSASIVNMSPSNLIGEVDTQFVTIPSVGALNLMNNKVRIESASLKGELNPDISQELSEFDYAPNDSNLLGTYFSTTDTVNYDIYNSEGYFEADDWVGDTDRRYNQDYPLLKYRARNYFQKYTSGTAIDLIMDLLARYDMSVFDQIQQLIPARADWHKGILIEPHVFERNKYRRPREITYTQHSYEGTVNLHDNVITASRHDYDAANIDLYDYKPSSYSNDTVVPTSSIEVVYPVSVNITSSTAVPSDFTDNEGSQIRFNSAADDLGNRRVDVVAHKNSTNFSVQDAVYLSASSATLYYTQSNGPSLASGTVTANHVSQSISQSFHSASFQNFSTYADGDNQIILTGSVQDGPGPGNNYLEFAKPGRTYTITIGTSAVNAQFRDDNGTYSSVVVQNNANVLDEQGSGRILFDMPQAEEFTNLRMRTNGQEAAGGLKVDVSFTKSTTVSHYFGTDVVTGSSNTTFQNISTSLPARKGFLKFDDGGGSHEYPILEKLSPTHIRVDTSSNVPNTSGSGVQVQVAYSSSAQANRTVDAYTDEYGPKGTLGQEETSTYITQRQQGYWQYSPTGSTVLNARKSKIYKVPKYFYSSAYSASVNLPSSTSMEYADVQDTRLPGPIENLYFNGCRITSDSLTTDSPDTPDGGPVVEITTVDPNILVFNGTSDNDESLQLNDGNVKEIKTIPTNVLRATQLRKKKVKKKSTRTSKVNETLSLRPTSFLIRNSRPKRILRQNKTNDILKLVQRMFRRFRG